MFTDSELGVAVLLLTGKKSTVQRQPTSLLPQRDN